MFWWVGGCVFAGGERWLGDVDLPVREFEHCVDVGGVCNQLLLTLSKRAAG